MRKEAIPPPASSAREIRSADRGAKTTPVPTAVAHPCDETSLAGALDADGPA